MTDTVLNLRPTQFSLVGLHLADVGPLRGLTSLSFVNDEGVPNDLYLMMGPNGAGKTTILEAIYKVMRLLERSVWPEGYGMPALDSEKGGVQIDARIVLDDGHRARSYLLSIVAGAPGLLYRPTEDDLRRAEADEPVVLRFHQAGVGEGVTRSATSDAIAIAFHNAVIAHVGEPSRDLFEGVAGYPTVLYFPSNRGIRRPPTEEGVVRPDLLAYAPARKFDTDGEFWSESLDNLFVWFSWLADDRASRCLDLVTRLVFTGRKELQAVDREQLIVPVKVRENGATHRLHELSSGERQLVQLVVRIASHMSGSTIVLIDEVEQHLHVVFQRRLTAVLKDWAREHPGLSFFMTSHQKEIFRFINPFKAEARLSKGAALIKPRYRISK
jgi:ABC-type lipoprotein export system ATPase subunit